MSEIDIQLRNPPTRRQRRIAAAVTIATAPAPAEPGGAPHPALAVLGALVVGPVHVRRPRP
ncbi:MAG: hypothetical protein R2716_08265 [Microthrixaceae bacterium]